MKAKNPVCPCGSSLKYGDCCRRYHHGDEPPSPEALMRSRFSAFALGEAEYLWRTLHPRHPDFQRGAAALTADVRRARQSLRYVRLRVLDSRVEGEGVGRVLFHAEVYERGRERSFYEDSRFEQDAGRWRYRSGEAKAMGASEPGLKALSLAALDAAG